MIVNAKIEMVFTGFFCKKRYSFLTKASLNTSLSLWIQEAIQNKKRIRRERRQERNRVETMEQKVENYGK